MRICVGAIGTRAAQDELIKSKDVQINLLGTNTELYKPMSYADAQKQLNAQKDQFEQRKAECEQTKAGHEAKLITLARELDTKLRELGQFEAESRALRMLVEQSAAATRDAAGSLADYRAAVAALHMRSDGPAVILRGGLQAMDEANRIAERNRANSPKTQFWVPTVQPVLPDASGPGNLDYEVV